MAEITVQTPEPAEITLTLTITQAKKLQDVLDWHEDEGPTGFGWQSNETATLCNMVREALKAQGK